MYDGNPQSGVLLVEHTYSSILSGHAKVLTVTANFPQGNHEIFVLVDPNDTISEASEINNNANKTLTVMSSEEVIEIALTADDIQFEPQLPEMGEEVVIQCSVRNQGTVHLKDVKVRIYEGNPDAGGSLLYPEFTLPVLEAGGSGQITIHHDTADWGGDHLIYFTADPENVIYEGDENNNQASRLLTVSAPAYPDLVVSAEGITIDPSNPLTGDTITMGCTVENKGSQPAALVEVEFYCGHPDNSLLLGVDTIENLQAGSSDTAEATWDTTDLAGLRIIYVIVDPSNAIPEANELNNLVEKEINIGAPDLEVTYEDITFIPEIPMEGESAQVNCEIHNVGVQSAQNVSINFYEGNPDEGGQLIGNSAIAEIAAGGQETATANWQVPTTEGAYRVYVTVDSQDTVLEENESNNIARRTVFISTQTDLLISLSDVSIYPLHPTLDDMVTVTALVWNKGGTDAYGIEVAFFDGDPDSGGVMIGDIHTISRLYGGSSEVVEKSFFLSEGEHEIYVIVDLNNIVAESDETNNQISVPVTVSALNDLCIKAEEIDITPVEPAAGDTLTISALIHNRGNEEYTDVIIQFFDGSPECGGEQIGSDQVVSLSGSGVVNAYTTYPDISGGSHEITVIVDPYDDIVEDEEGNNRASRQIIVYSTEPDLTVNQGNFTFTPLSPRSGEVVALTARVSNHGDTPTEIVLVRFYEGPPEGSGYQLGGVSIDSIDAHGSEDAVVETILKEGAHDLYLAVDPEDTIAESNENNNLSMISLVVQPLDGFYDDCGNPGQEPHLVQGDDTTIDGVHPENPPASLTASNHPASIQYAYTGLNPNSQYQLIVNYLEEDGGERVQSLSADGVTIHEGLALPDGRAEYFTFQLPFEAYSDGDVALSFDLVSGPDVLVSEIFIVKNIDKKEEGLSSGINWLISHQSEVGGWSDYIVTLNDAFAVNAFATCGRTQLPEYNLLLERLKNIQASNNSWGGVVYTCESIQALLKAGKNPQDSEIQSAVSWLKRSQKDDGSWESAKNTGIAIVALIKVGENPDSIIIQQAAQWLIDTQIETGYNKGFWGGSPSDPVVSPYVGPYPVIGLVMATSPTNTAVIKAKNYFISAPSSWYDSHPFLAHCFLEIMRHTDGSSSDIINMINKLVNHQGTDGGWARQDRIYTPLSQPDMTGEIIQSLCESKEEYTIPESIDVDEAIERGVQFLVDKTTPWGDIFSPYDKTDLTAIAALSLRYSNYSGSSNVIENSLRRIIECQSPAGYWESYLIHPDTPGYQWSSLPKIEATADSILALSEIPIPLQGKDASIAEGIQVLFSNQCSGSLGTGWPRQGGSGYTSDTRITCWVIRALLKSGISPQDIHITNGLDWLMSQRISDGSFGGLEATTLATLIFKEIGGYAQEITDAITWIKDKQKPDGGWGGVYNTSWALIALSSHGETGIEVYKGVSWLLSAQNPDEGWDSLIGVPASETRYSTLATWALAVSKYQMDIELELIFNKPFYYPGDLVKMAVNPLNAEAGSLVLSGTVMEYEGEALPLTVSQSGDTFSAWHLLRGDHLSGTDMVNIVAISDEGQGSATGSFVVKNAEGVLPDVSVVSDDIAFSTHIPQEGELVTIVATISNSEIRDAVNVTMQCYDGYPGSGGVFIGEDSVERISGLSTVDVSFDWQATSGMHEIYLVLDPDDTLPETNELNNRTYKTISVPALASGPDLSVAASDITLTPSVPTEGEEVLIGAVVHNLGGSEASDILIRFFDGNPDEPDNQIGEDQMISTLSPGNSEVVEVAWDTLGELGRSYLHVVVDPEGSIEETKENNNEAIKIIDVGEFSRPDLALNSSDISFVPLTLLEGEEVKISAEIHNRGKPAQNIKVVFYDGDPEDDGVLIKEEIIYSTISTGESEILEVGWDTVGAAESHDIYVVIDPEEMIVEENEGNNKASAGITVDSSGLAVEVSLDRVEYEAEEDASISAVITNLRQEQRVVTFDLLTEDSEGNVISELIISETINLGPTDEVISDLVWNTGSIKAGQYSILAVVNENGTPRVTDSADFIITADLSLSAKVVTDRMVYFSYEQAKIASIIQSFSPNYTFSNLYAEITVKNELDEILYSDDKSIATLLPLDNFRWDTYWNTQTHPPGEYIVVLEVTGGGGSMASDLKSASILPSYEGEMALKGSLTVDPTEVNRGDDILLSYEVENIGNVALPDVNLLFQVVHVETEDFVTALSDQCSLDLGKSYSGSLTLSTLGMPAGACLMVLLGEVEGVNQTVAFVPLTIINQCPVADGGEDRLVTIGETVVLDGSKSFDPDGSEITYSWSLIEKPQGSSAELLNPNDQNPSITPDLHGDYLIRLVVSDGLCDSEPDLVLVTTGNRPPVADAGDNQIVSVGDSVSLNGGASTDPDGDLIIAYHWLIVSKPDGSTATLSDSQIVDPTFVADLAGEYIIELTVSDWELESEPDTVVITANQLIPLPPNLLEDAISLEEEAVSLLSENGDFQEARARIQNAIIKLEDIIDLLNSNSSINVSSNEDFPGAICYLNMAIYFDKIALRLIKRNSPRRRSAAIANLMIADWFKGRALEIIE